ncbi:MAG: hypothetical protein HY930_05895 [Euryarchaeota archaeon]|nr:hypothetical protein [Euryarchaeota archaeon]
MREILRLLKERGPLTGRELYELTGVEVFELWRSCNASKDLIIKKVGRHYLRFDKDVEGYARLSPAIQREFLTYSVVGLKKDEVKVRQKARKLSLEIKKISQRKFELAKSAIAEMIAKLGDAQIKNVCFVIGGDVAVEMAHNNLRPERSTGELVTGSDLDIVVMTRDDFSGLKELDEAMHKTKAALLKLHREEIDYKIKSSSKVAEQAKFDTFEHIIACKIMNEAKFLYGSKSVYKQVLRILKESSVPEKLKKLEKIAVEKRKEAEEYLLRKGKISEEEYFKLFTTTEEFGEIF